MTMGMLFCGESGICGTLSVDGGTRWREMVVERGGVGLEREERIYYGAGVLRIARGTSRFKADFPNVACLRVVVINTKH